jgi:hypothetical protein
MKIFGVRIGWFNTRGKRRRKMPNELDRMINAAMLDGAVNDREFLATIVNKYGKIQVPPDGMIPAEAKTIRDKARAESAQTILSSRREELISRLNGIIDRVMGLDSYPVEHRHPETPFEGGTHDKHSDKHKAVNTQRNIERGVNPSVPIRNLTIHALLDKLGEHHRNKQVGSAEE